MCSTLDFTLKNHCGETKSNKWRKKSKEAERERERWRWSKRERGRDEELATACTIMNESSIVIGLCQQKRRNFITHLNSVGDYDKTENYMHQKVYLRRKEHWDENGRAKNIHDLTYCGKSKPLALNHLPAKF